MTEDDKLRSWHLLLQEAVRDTNPAGLQALIHELNNELHARENRPKPELVRAKLEPELLEFRHDHSRFRRVFDELHEFAGLLSPDGRLTFSNRSALEFLGVGLESIVGKPVWELPTWEASEGRQERLVASVGRAARGDFVQYDVEVLGKGGPVWINFSITPIRDADGRVEMLLPEGKPYPQRVEEPIVEGEFLAELLRVEHLRRRIRNHVVTACASCHRIRDGARWYFVAEELIDSFDLTLVPAICPDCELSLAQLASQGYRL
jgi:PAS domain S-box-containing protein